MARARADAAEAGGSGPEVQGVRPDAEPSEGAARAAEAAEAAPSASGPGRDDGQGRPAGPAGRGPASEEPGESRAELPERAARRTGGIGAAVEPSRRPLAGVGAGGRWSLRTRLILAFAAIISLTLALVTLGFVFILREYQAQRETIRLGTLAASLALQLRTPEAQALAADGLYDLLRRQADELDVRIALAGPQGAIYFDTEGTLVGQRIDLQAARRVGPLRRTGLARGVGDDAGRVFVVAGPIPQERAGDRRPFVLALASEPVTVWTVLAEMAPRLALAALVPLLASIGVAWLLAGSIARPLARMTRAAEAMARGHYDQEIPDRGSDEVGRLAAAFNAMAREVARSQRTLRDFVANVSHDLRTPLTSIQGFSQAMVDGAIARPEEYRAAGRVVNEEAGRMRRMVEDVLDLSKIESGQVTLALAPLDPAEAAAQAVARAERRAAGRGVAARAVAEGAPLVHADRRWIERALDNLLDNALKHTPSGAAVTVTTARAAGGWAAVRVHNEGSYIPPDELPRVFERFYTRDKSRAGSAAGSGLGLAIAREVAQAHGGRLVAESSPTGGTTFSLLLPPEAGA